ncbi:MAG: phosphatase PAP2 family protein [Rubrivivax sp.]|nr:phosphatase PAP2 family protein [Rubrivivax sp.]
MMATGARDLRITGLALAALALWEASGWDLVVARWFGNGAGFGWRDHWLTSGLLHQGGRGLAWLMLAGLLALTLKAWRRPAARHEHLRWTAATLAGLLLVPAIKRVSSTSCPWDLAEFGGLADYVPHWQLGLTDGGAGHCFPSGHAVAAFAFFSLYFLWRRSHPARARGALAAVLALGLLFGWAQLARGAHFPSHSLWSAWLCWALCVGADRARIALGWRGRRVVPAAPRLR